MNFLRKLFVGLIFLPALVSLSTAQDSGPVFPDPQSETVSDFASALTATEEGRISRILAETQEKTGVQIVVVTAPGLEALNGGGMRLDEFGRALFDAWGIGDDERNDGILILIDTVAREARITLGTGYDRVYDERAARVLSTALLPKLRESGLAAGIEAGIISARDKLVTPFQSGEPITATEGFPEPDSNLPQRIGLGLAGILGFVGLYLWRRARARRICPKCRALTLTRTREVITPPTKFQDGIGVEHLDCTSCGFAERNSFTIRRDSPEAEKNRQQRLAALEKAADSTPKERQTGFDGGKSGDGGASGKW